jgi:pyruvate dehydrogenase E2 component (dihydrolipoamide acetyltransferase)
MIPASTSEGATVVRMPKLSDSMEQGTVVRWLLANGEIVAQGQDMVEIETDKATMTYGAPAAGPLWIVVSVDATVAVGEPIAYLGGERPALQ